ncbi:cytochrome c oxidase subunit II [Paracoccus aestuariivivens]|uniref:C-type cytochrome n=1 Tax=Paracoccus aestuariivivens TaxID=1820333 RepID=A0A6L6JCK4_9RHOB|nr:c-type cytochrome [Paracoccus aestuariivivens]MTH79923.1 c-type cytochrome [Paracoccus aestuariivivens]
MAWLSTLFLAGCKGQQSVLAPAGRDAEVLAGLFWVLLAGAVVLWLAVNGLMLYIAHLNPRPQSRRMAEGLIIGGGIVLPTLLLTALLIYSLREMPRQREAGSGLTVRITGESWWWRVEYLREGTPIASANEVRLPTGSRSELVLEASEYIHSFWIPAFGGKTDMIPGRTTRMSLEPTKSGEYRGQCTEFCGESHARMALIGVAMEPQDFAEWLTAQAGPADDPLTPQAMRGRDIFLREGCGGCHTIRGTPAQGAVGPDLTHFGGRRSLAAATLPMERQALIDWLRDPAAIKPGVRMPAYDHVPEADLADLATYLEGLE